MSSFQAHVSPPVLLVKRQVWRESGGFVNDRARGESADLCGQRKSDAERELRDAVTSRTRWIRERAQSCGEFPGSPRDQEKRDGGIEEWWPKVRDQFCPERFRVSSNPAPLPACGTTPVRGQEGR